MVNSGLTRLVNVGQCPFCGMHTNKSILEKSLNQDLRMLVTQPEVVSYTEMGG